MTFDIDIAIVIAFLLLNLTVGLYYGRGVTTIEGYATGGRNFSTAALVSTIVATAVSGTLFTIGISRTYSNGLYNLIPTCGFAISFLLLAYFFIPKMKSFLGDISIAESMGKHYGKHVRIITAICAIIANVGVIAVQYKVFGGIVSYFLEVELFVTIIVSGMVVTIYSAFGGIRSVTFTDIIQFMIFGTVIPLIGIILWKTTIRLEDFSFTTALSNPNFNLQHVLDYNKHDFWDMLLLFCYLIIPSSASYFQRIMMGSTIKQSQKAFTIASMVLLIIVFAVAWIGFLLFSLEPSLSSDQLVPYIIDNYTYVGLKGFVIAGITAMVMSSADSFINIASVLFAHDVCTASGLKIKNELALTRIVALVIGVGSVILALSENDLLEIMLSANAFYMPIVTAPLLFTILGFQTTKYSVLSGMAGGFFTVIIWKIIGINLDPIIPAMLVNLIIMMSVHYIGEQQGGWSDVKDYEDVNITKEDRKTHKY